jgi:hypothetical protein
MRNIMKCTHYMASYDPSRTNRMDIIVEWLEDHKPPGTLVPVERLAGGVLFEIDAVSWPNAPQKHIKTDDEERQLSNQYCFFPHRPRSRLIPILKMLLLNLFLLLFTYLICSEF